MIHSCGYNPMYVCFVVNAFPDLDTVYRKYWSHNTKNIKTESVCPYSPRHTMCWLALCTQQPGHNQQAGLLHCSLAFCSSVLAWWRSGAKTSLCCDQEGVVSTPSVCYTTPVKMAYL